ncbi:MAG: ribonuclease G [Armatimonadota bacterium]
MEENTSGQGASSIVPEEIRGWNWGAFFLTWMWAVSMNTWVGLVALIPGVHLIMMFILGARGNEWAWQNRKWQSLGHFTKVQMIWGISGVAITVITAYTLWKIWSILLPVFMANQLF